MVGLAAMLLAAAFATAGEHGVAATARGAVPPPITLGLFLPATGSAAPVGEDVSRGAAIAVSRANEKGGVAGRRIRLVTAASDRLWDGASGELVRLIYDEGAQALRGKGEFGVRPPI